MENNYVAIVGSKGGIAGNLGTVLVGDGVRLRGSAITEHTILPEKEMVLFRGPRFKRTLK